MHPEIFHVGGMTLRSYGLMLALAFMIGIAIAHARAPRHGVEPQRLLDVYLIIVFGALVGSRLLFIAEHASTYAADPSRLLQLRQGGLSMYGGVLLAAAGAALYCKRTGISFLALADTCAPSLALGEAITRIGCFLNGCCFGMPSSLPWAMVFPDQSNAGHAFHGIAIHPTQLYASLAHVAIFAVLLAVGAKPQKRGRLIGLFLLLHATARLAVDTLRYQAPSAIDVGLGGLLLTPSRLVCVALFALGCWILAGARAPVPAPVIARGERRAGDGQTKRASKAR
jgi:phosphatidylglycerol:prolipoprotein diacylglycerol transferase